MGKEFLTIYWREMIRFVRFKGQLFAALVQPDSARNVRIAPSLKAEPIH